MSTDQKQTTEECGDCGGSGYFQRQRGAGVWEDRQCPVCAGTGRHVRGQPGVLAGHQPGPECRWCGLTHGPCNGGCVLPHAVSDAPAAARDAIMRARLEIHEPPARVEDMAAMIQQMAYRLRKADPDSSWPARATDYLRRKGLLGGPLREGAIHE